MFSKSYCQPNSFPNGTDLERDISLINDYEKARKNVCEEFKNLNKCLFELNNIEKRLLEDLSNSSVIIDSSLEELITNWKVCFDDIGKNRQDLATSISRTVLEPLRSFHVAFDEMKNAIKKYEQLLNDSVKYKQKVSKYKDCDRTPSNIMKLHDYERMLASTEDDCKTLKDILERELPLFFQKRVEYFHPSLAAYVSSQILYSGNNLSALKSINSALENYTECDLKEKQNKLFESIDSLSIVSK